MESAALSGLFLGFDSSTQSLKVTALNSSLQTVKSEAINFDASFPHYGTKDGVRRDASNSDRITAPPQMWIEAMELALLKLKGASFPFSQVTAISGSGQQHGSVYWKRGARSRLRSLKSSESMASQLKNWFSTDESPIWMDSSTTKQCGAMEAALGGPLALARLTGSRAYERFTGPQIRKLYEEKQDVYEDTERISLVSSFCASLLIGDYAAIDHSDGAGMNLMDLVKRTWSPSALQATAPELEERLGPLTSPYSVLGPIHPYFVERFGFREDCVVVAWSGDNPCSLAGLALARVGDVAVSLGTSDTVFGIVKNEDASPGMEGHVFPSPIDPSTSMIMLCYKNASLARQVIRDRCAAGSWETFEALLRCSPPLNGGKMGFYFFDSEILPPLPAGVHRFEVEEWGEENPPRSDSEDVNSSAVTRRSLLASFDDASEVRAVVEGQLAAMRGHSERVGIPSPAARVVATGGGSANDSLLQTMADVFGCSVLTAQRPDSASLGAALRAAHGWLCWKRGQFVSFEEVLGFAGDGSAVGLEDAKSVSGPSVYRLYGALVKKRMALEAILLQEAQPSQTTDS